MTTDHVVEPRLRALPVQLIPMRSAVILRRSATEVRIDGARAREAVEAVLAAVSRPGATVAEVCERFAEPDRPAVTRLLGELRTRRLLVPARSRTPVGYDTVPDDAITDDTVTDDTAVGDSRLDVFYWHFGQHGADVARSLSSRQIAVVGVNAVSRHLVPALTAIGAMNIEVVDYPPLRGVELVGTDNGAGASVVHADWLDRADADEIHCVIATSDFGASECLRLWNRFCVECGIPFFPVVQHDLLGTVGPLVMPGETPCYECVRAGRARTWPTPPCATPLRKPRSRGSGSRPCTRRRQPCSPSWPPLSCPSGSAAAGPHAPGGDAGGGQRRGAGGGGPQGAAGAPVPGVQSRQRALGGRGP
ncbi:MAG: hypothetical protein ACRDRI_21895 [Pseudonocardiaceae bacterium]